MDTFFLEKTKVAVEVETFDAFCLRKYGEVFKPLSESEMANLLGGQARRAFSYLSAREINLIKSLERRQAIYAEKENAWYAEMPVEEVSTMRGQGFLSDSTRAFYRSKLKRFLRVGLPIPTWESFVETLALDPNDPSTIQMHSEWFALLETKASQ